MFMVGHHVAPYGEVIQEDPGMAGVFAGDNIRLLQHIHRPLRNVCQISYGCGHQVEGARFHFVHMSSFPYISSISFV